MGFTPKKDKGSRKMKEASEWVKIIREDHGATDLEYLNIKEPVWGELVRAIQEDVMDTSESDWMSKAHAAERDRDHVVAALEKSRNEHQHSLFDWKAAEKVVTELKEKLIIKVRQLESTEKELEDSAHELGVQDAKLKSLQSEVLRLEAEGVSIAEEATTLKKANEGFRHKLDVEAKEKEILLTRISEYSVWLESANETIAGRSKDLRKAHLDELALQERVKELESDVEHQGKIIPSLTERVDHLRVENTRVRANLERAMGLLVSQHANEL